MDPRILILAPVIAGGVLLTNELRHDFRAIWNHGCCRVVTSHPVVCPRHHVLYMDDAHWAKYQDGDGWGQWQAPSLPYCPKCRRIAEFPAVAPAASIGGRPAEPETSRAGDGNLPRIEREYELD